MAEDSDAWEQNRKLVVYRLGVIDDRLRALGDKVESLDRHLTSLSVRASVWGGLAGLFMAAIITAVARRLLG